MSISNMASTMVALLASNPALQHTDLSSMRLLSCGGSPQTPTVVTRVIAAFACEFFVSYGMTECCGKISMSLLEPSVVAAAAVAAEASLAAALPHPWPSSAATADELMPLINTSGRPFELMEVSFAEAAAWRRSIRIDRPHCAAR